MAHNGPHALLAEVWSKFKMHHAFSDIGHEQKENEPGICRIFHSLFRASISLHLKYNWEFHIDIVCCACAQNFRPSAHSFLQLAGNLHLRVLFLLPQIPIENFLAQSERSCSVFFPGHVGTQQINEQTRKRNQLIMKEFVWSSQVFVWCWTLSFPERQGKDALKDAMPVKISASHRTTLPSCRFLCASWLVSGWPHERWQLTNSKAEKVRQNASKILNLGVASELNSMTPHLHWTTRSFARNKRNDQEHVQYWLASVVLCQWALVF